MTTLPSRAEPAATKGRWLSRFMESEASGGLVLMAAAALALLVANSPLAPAYFAALKTYLGPLTVSYWINDGLMALFFLLVGLEIKREVLIGELSTWNRRVLPGLAAAGGMAAPALIYLAFNGASPEAARGWAIPAATDIAFALGVLALLGPRVPLGLKVFLTALAIIDDLGAVLIIALFYTGGLDVTMLAGAAATLAVLVALNRFKVERLSVYLALGAVLWVFVLRSGVHATIAGVLLALTIPLGHEPDRRPGEGPLHGPLPRLEHILHRWVAFVVAPVFGFANAGVALGGVTLATLAQPIPLGIALGLFVGKQVGVFGVALLAIRLGWAQLPHGATMRQLYGVSLLAGIGFTMSLFIGLLAFPGDPARQDLVKIGVLAGSLLSGVVGFLVLRFGAPSRSLAARPL